MQLMPDPSCPYLGNLLDAWGVLGCMGDGVDNLRINTIEETRKDRPTGLPHNPQDDGRNQ